MKKIRFPPWLKRNVKANKGEYEHVPTETGMDESSHDANLSVSTSTENSVADRGVCISSKMKETLLAWISMLLAIMSGSSIGPLFKFLNDRGVPPMRAASWRCQCMVIWLAPLAMLEYYVTPADQQPSWSARKEDLYFQLWVHVLIAGILWAANLLAWIVALSYTTTVRASLFADIHPLMLVILLRLQGTTVSFFEWLGVFVCIVGVFITGYEGMRDIFAAKHTSAESVAFYGDLLCVFASLMQVFVILNRHGLKKYVPLMQVRPRGLIATLV